MSDPATERKEPHVVILGAGFGGLEAARTLARSRVQVTVIDKRNHHLFQPLLYQVATAALSATDIAAPIRKLLVDQTNTKVLLARAVGVDTEKKVVQLTDGQVPYDYLIVAAGMTNSYFGHDDWEAFAPGLKSLEDALEIRRRVLFAYEAAERETDPEKQRHWLSFVVVGGGPTGVELAGALSEIARRTMAANFRTYDPSSARVVLVEGGSRLLAAFPEDLAKRAERDLAELGVEVRLSTRVTAIDEDGISLGAERIAARTVVWGAGVAGVPVAKTLGVPVDRQGRIAVQHDLSVQGKDGVFVVGDLAAFQQEDGTFVPGVAPAAIQQGHLAAKNVIHLVRKEGTETFQYFDKGSMATIGRSRAIAVAGNLKMTGFLAWLAWLFVHVLSLVGFRNRVVVLLEWAWAYVSFQRSARIILSSTVPREPYPVASQRVPKVPEKETVTS
jgi:NADH:ubiquinone reductase (H+-translocating)